MCVSIVHERTRASMSGILQWREKKNEEGRERCGMTDTLSALHLVVGVTVLLVVDHLVFFACVAMSSTDLLSHHHHSVSTHC